MDNGLLNYNIYDDSHSKRKRLRFQNVGAIWRSSRSRDLRWRNGLPNRVAELPYSQSINGSPPPAVLQKSTTMVDATCQTIIEAPIQQHTNEQGTKQQNLQQQVPPQQDHSQAQIQQPQSLIERFLNYAPESLRIPRIRFDFEVIILNSHLYILFPIILSIFFPLNDFIFLIFLLLFSVTAKVFIKYTNF